MASSGDLPYQHMDKKELEKQYSPSKWSPRLPEDTIIPVHVEFAEKASAKSKAEVLHRCGVITSPCGSDKTGLLDIYGEDLPKHCPFFVYVHGGYWQELNKDLSGYIVQPLYKEKIITVVLGYTTAPKGDISQMISEIRAGIKYVCRLAEERGSEGVVLGGWSAGGHLIQQVLSTWPDESNSHDKLIKGAVTFAGVFDLIPLVGTYVNDPLHLTIDSAKTLSPMYNTTSLKKLWPKIKILLLYGSHDSPEFKRQSVQYSEVCKKDGLEATYEEVKDMDHFNLVEELSNEHSDVFKFVYKFIKSV